MQASVAAQLGLYGGKVGAPRAFIDTLLVLLHPGQKVLDVANGHIIQLRSRPRSGQDGALGSGHCGLQTKVVVTAQVDQTFVEAVNPVEESRLFF